MVNTNRGGSLNYSATTTTPATFGQTGAIPYRRTEYDRYLTVAIYDLDVAEGDSAPKVFEGRALSSGSSSELAMVMPAMVEALFKRFPGISGKAETISVPMDR